MSHLFCLLLHTILQFTNAIWKFKFSKARNNIARRAHVLHFWVNICQSGDGTQRKKKSCQPNIQPKKIVYISIYMAITHRERSPLHFGCDDDEERCVTSDDLSSLCVIWEYPRNFPSSSVRNRACPTHYTRHRRS